MISMFFSTHDKTNKIKWHSGVNDGRPQWFKYHFRSIYPQGALAAESWLQGNTWLSEPMISVSGDNAGAISCWISWLNIAIEIVWLSCRIQTEWPSCNIMGLGDWAQRRNITSYGWSLGTKISNADLGRIVPFCYQLLSLAFIVPV